MEHYQGCHYNCIILNKFYSYHTDPYNLKIKKASVQMPNAELKGYTLLSAPDISPLYRVWACSLKCHPQHLRLIDYL